jgi:mannose-6-phosphate isomerase-like protein (cupin superfamily)
MMDATALTQIPPRLRQRLVRYDELIPCTNAFIDARSPGSDLKENFTIIGPGVAENPHQHVHIREPHGFNIGAARQPPGCTNSLHSHDSAEVFIIYRGRWRFFWGEHGDSGEVFLNPGDTISIPIHVFRGFENVGEDIGFMFAVLGGDDPGRVHWAPHVIEKAQGYGLVLLENGQLVDTTLGEQVPAGEIAVRPSTKAEIAYIRVPNANEMQSNVARGDKLAGEQTSPLAAEGIEDAAVIVSKLAGDDAAAPISSAHDFTIRRLAMRAGSQTRRYTFGASEVLLVQRGSLAWHEFDGEAVRTVPLNAGDTFSAPLLAPRWLTATTDAEVFVVRTADAALQVFPESVGGRITASGQR